MRINKAITASTCMAVLFLTACGGGDGSASTTSSDNAVTTPQGTGSTPTPTPTPTPAPVVDGPYTPFLGSWDYQSDDCSELPSVPATSGPNAQRGREVGVEFTATSMSETAVVYADVKCTQPVGSVITTWTLQWSPMVAPQDWSHAARLDYTAVSYKVTGGVVLASGYVDHRESRKGALAIRNNKMYFLLGATTDADGYPTDFSWDPVHDNGAVRVTP